MAIRAPSLRADLSARTAKQQTNGHVLICQHQNRRIVRVGKDLHMMPVVERYQGNRLNSPNDLVYRSDGALYFTDPPYGLPKQVETPPKSFRSMACTG